MRCMKPALSAMSAISALCLVATGAWAQGSTVYRCPGPPVTYTDAFTAQEAKDRGCRTIEGAPITIVQIPKPRPVQAPAASAPRPADSKVPPAEQRERDSDARRILESELQREEARLDDLQRQFNNGQPERLGSEQNYQRYLDRVETMKAEIARKEGDIAAIKRELAKLPAS
jgi:hypothetical protein